LTYPMPGVSLRWYKEFFNAVMWTLSIKNSFIIAGATTALATTLGTLAALGLTMTNLPFKGLITGITSFDEVVVALFIAGPEQYTLPRQMFAGIREKYNPTIAAVATMMIVVSVLLLVTVELLRRRNERLRGISDEG